MLNTLWYKIRHGIITLRFSILSIFVTLFTVAVLLLISITYVRYTDALKYIALQLMNRSSTEAHRQLDQTLGAASSAGHFSTQLINHGILDTANQKQMINYMYHLLEHLPYVQGVGWGDESGNFILNEKVANGTVETEIFNRNVVPATHIILLRDVSGNVVRQFSSTDMSYDPRVRPWYLLTKKLKRQAWTPVYLFRFDNLPGISVAEPVYKNGKLKGSFLIDIRLDYLSKFISTDEVSPNGITYIVSQDDKVIALPQVIKEEEQRSHKIDLIDVHSLKNTWIPQSFDIYKKTGKKTFTYSDDENHYLATYQTIKNLAFSGWVIGVIVPEPDLIGQLQNTNLINLLISLSILILGIWLVLYFVSRVVTPLDRLTKETEKIRNFDLSEDNPVQSRIREVMSLSNAIQSMKIGLRSFQKYVPAELVRSLMKSEQHAKLSGSKKQLAVFFSDIENFTSIAEKMDPTQLMEHICEYFDVLSIIIVTEKGTIDKYIGDSIMAFWGAPLPEPKPAHQSAYAALICMKELDHVNQKWEKAGKPRFNTRIGLHIGEAIVGNLGSSERLNYTAIGDTINLASRLEGINKIYGSRIAVSEAFYNIIKNDFVLRMLDCIQVKGKEENSFIYELLGTKHDKIAFDVDEYNTAFSHAFAAYQQQYWEEAIHSFNTCLAIYPADKVAHVFIERCERLKQLPPSKEWNGVWKMHEKS